MDRIEREKRIFLAWLREPHPESEYVLIKAKDYDLFGPEVATLVIPLHREQGLKRNEIMLVRAPSPPSLRPMAHRPTRRATSRPCAS